MKTCCQITRIKYNAKENAATKEEQTPHSGYENINDSEIEDKRNLCSEPSNKQWTDRNKSHGKRKISVYLNEMNDPIVLEPELKSSRKFKSNLNLNQAKYSKNIQKNTGKTR